MFVLTGEGHRWLNRNTWTTHAVLGVFRTEPEALASAQLEGLDDDDLVLLTNTDTGEARRVDLRA